MPRPVQGGQVHVSTPSGVTSPFFSLPFHQAEARVLTVACPRCGEDREKCPCWDVVVHGRQDR